MIEKSLIDRLNKRITIQTKTITSDGFGSHNEVWTNLAIVWAEINPISNKNVFEANKIDDKTTHIITIRYYASLTTKDRIKYGDRIFNIIGIINPLENNKIMQIKVEEMFA